LYIFLGIGEIKIPDKSPDKFAPWTIGRRLVEGVIPQIIAK
jgi:hypothetical protein